MGAGNYSVEASIIENGKLIRGTLTLFNDEYVFGGNRKTVNWENVICEQGTKTIKGFLRSSVKNYIVFNCAGDKSEQFIMESSQISSVLSKVKEYKDTIREKSLQKKAVENQKESEVKCSGIAEKDRKELEKKERLKRIVEVAKIKSEDNINVVAISEKAASVFLDNPYRILGISCNATNEEANAALDKIKKLARLKAIESYKSPFDLTRIKQPKRDLSVAQNALALLKDVQYKLFWFSNADSCIVWHDYKYRIELVKDGEDLGTYDLFLANYMYAILCDPNFTVPETWKRVFNYYVYICNQTDCELIRSRFLEKDLQNIKNADLLSIFRSIIFKPILLLCERDDLDAEIRLHKCIKDCNRKELEELSRHVLGKIVSWFTDKESAVLSYLRTFDGETEVSNAVGEEIRKRGEDYCHVVEPYIEIVLRNFRADLVRYEMVKESYRNTTYMLMYELNKCSNKSNAIMFANKCFGYCNSDDKKRIKNTFGDINIKIIDWNIPHTIWDNKGDDFYYGRGCEVDYVQALYWYHKAADEGNMYSKNSIALCYQEGHGVPQSKEQAVEWFKQATEAGNPQGAYNLAECYFNGSGTRKNVDMALKYWKVADKLGHPSAKNREIEIFSKVQAQRRSHRLRNHICHDLGFQMTTGPLVYVEVLISQAANVYLVNQQGYQNYLNGNEFIHYGGYTEKSPYRIRIPSSNHWYVIVDNGDESIYGITSSAKIKNI